MWVFMLCYFMVPYGNVSTYANVNQHQRKNSNPPLQYHADIVTKLVTYLILIHNRSYEVFRKSSYYYMRDTIKSNKDHSNN